MTPLHRNGNVDTYTLLCRIFVGYDIRICMFMLLHFHASYLWQLIFVLSPSRFRMFSTVNVPLQVLQMRVVVVVEGIGVGSGVGCLLPISN